MRKIILGILILWTGIPAWAWTSPIDIPDTGDATLRIVGQNAANYVSDLTAANSSCETQEQFDIKTDKMANVFLALKADIVAICEVERNDDILSYICAAMNTLYGEEVYTYITDGLHASQSQDGYMPLKSGFIYRSDKVTPYGTSKSPYSYGEYCARLRIQAFTDNATGELFTLSMNHFKAKSKNTPDETETTRLQNVSYLLTALNKITYDDDIMILGDLNAYTEEAPVQNLIEAGYEEQLVRFDPGAYSYIYYSQKGLLDHAMANTSMAAQITGAYTYHINTSGYYSYKYSDHDAYVIGLRPGEQVNAGIERPEIGPAAHKLLRNGQLLIEKNGQLFTITGTLIRP